MIKNIIFDFGDIFINLKKSATIDELNKLGVTNISESMIKIYHQYEMGKISTEEFVNYFHKEFNLKKEEIIRCWNAILLDFPKRRLDFLKTLYNSKKYRLFLLSNTNDLHISWIKENLGDKVYNEFKNYFEKFYLSHEINFRKPNINIYEFVLEQNNLNAEETLFIDDTKENTDAAEKIGIKVWNLIPNKQDVVNLLNKKEFF